MVSRDENCGKGGLEFKRQGRLRGAGGPTEGFADGREREAMQRSGAQAAERFEVNGRAIAFMLGETVAGEIGVEAVEAIVAMGFGEDGGGRNGNAARVAFDERLLFDEDVELHGVDQKIVRNDGELLKSGGHGLAAGLIDIPGVDARGIDFGDGPGERVFANAKGEFGAAVSREFFGIVQTDDAALGIENDGGGNDRTEERAAAGFVNASDARPAEFARGSLKTG